MFILVVASVEFVFLYYKRMDPSRRESQSERKKEKKKKHERSRSQDKKKKKEKDRDGSREHRKKDKEKKHHKDKDRSRSKDKKEKEKERERFKEVQKKDKEADREKKDGDREKRDRSRDKEADREKKDWSRGREGEREKRDRSKGREGEREKKDRSRERQKGDRSKGREGERERKGDRQKRDRSRDKEGDRDKRERSKGREGDREKKEEDRERRDRSRDRQKSREKKQRKERRSRSRSKKRKNDDRRGDREDKYEKWRKQKDTHFRFDSPPKSDQSNISDDPEKMDELNKMKAEKELVSSKADRKLYLGNLPPNITSNQLMQMLNTALKKMEINTEIDGDSIVSAWVSPDGVGHYAFVEFRSALEATAGLALNGASLYGYQLKLGRPKQYIEYQKQLLNKLGSDVNIDTILKKFQTIGGFQQSLMVQDRIVYPPSRVIVLKHIVTIEELAIDEEYNEIVQDVTEMAKRFGDILKLTIPRPMQIDLEQVKRRVKGLGYVFIKYKSVDYARFARKEFIKQMFSDRSVACSYFPQKFEDGELDVIEKVVIDF